ncbi:MAG: hypothetical protein II729_03800 [Ruminococcus sp.]|nr:hypothetical protein [Ruminococcus sp.]
MTERVELFKVFREERIGESVPAENSLKFTHEGQSGNLCGGIICSHVHSRVGPDVSLR